MAVDTLLICKNCREAFDGRDVERDEFLYSDGTFFVVICPHCGYPACEDLCDVIEIDASEVAK